jgi:hypothetical protein
MPRFTARALPFGRPPTAPVDDDGEGLPRPALVKLRARRALGIAEAEAALGHLPGEGESLHCVCTARMDLTDLVNGLLGRLGPCERMRIATLGYNQRNLRAMLGWLDAGAVRGLSLVASIFFRAHNGELWQTTLEEFHRRGQRAACTHSHAKVLTLAFASGERLSIEGSANLCGNGSAREQFAVVNDAGLHDWHAGWIDALLARHEKGGADGG